MYIIKNAWKSIVRSKGRNILIGIIVTIVTISACIALAINKSGDTLVESYKSSNPLEVSFKLDPSSLIEATDEEKEAFETLTIEMIEDYANSSLVSDYYYTLELSLNADGIDPVDYSTLSLSSDEDDTTTEEETNRPVQMDSGDFRVTAYSDFSYLEDFIDDTKKIIEGSMIEKDNTEAVIVISEDLAEANDIELGDKIALYDSSDEDTTYKFEVVGIYEDNSDVSEDSFSGMNSMNSRNQLYTNLTSLNEIIEANPSDTTTSTNTKRMTSQNGLSAKIYLNDNDSLEEFEAEVREKGLSDYYSLNTNESETLASLKPIQNISNFSITFLIVIFVVGATVLTVINLINIRERKYEIGVLRAIGMSKLKVTLQLVSEIFIVSLISLIIGTTIGTLASQPVANMMLQSEIDSYTEELTTTQNNFGSGDFSRPSMDSGSTIKNMATSTDYIDSLAINIDIVTILELVLVSISLTLISGVVAVSFVNKYEPNKILQNR